MRAAAFPAPSFQERRAGADGHRVIVTWCVFAPVRVQIMPGMGNGGWDLVHAKWTARLIIDSQCTSPEKRVVWYSRLEIARRLAELFSSNVYFPLAPRPVSGHIVFTAGMDPADTGETQMTKVITYSAASGGEIDLTRAQIAKLTHAGVWPRTARGEEYCQVAHGLHSGEPTYSTAEIAALITP
tara:strand:+ start:212 stop:763 length:552 start_codon:yes stop_codon:yes gene_type:complete